MLIAGVAAGAARTRAKSAVSSMLLSANEVLLVPQLASPVASAPILRLYRLLLIPSVFGVPPS